MPVTLAPQPGPQTDFLASYADIAIYGGAAGGGKSFALLLDPCRWYKTEGFRGVIFRRTVNEFKDGGLWDESKDIYPHIGAKANNTDLVWRFPGGGSLKFSGMEHESDRRKHQGKQYSFIGFDELTHFTEKQFWYLVSRNRDAKSGIKPYVRATCNPDPNSFVKQLIRWYLDENGEYADPEKSGKLRYMYRYNEEVHWADTREELCNKFGVPPAEILSFTFIASNIFDNKILMENDPKYIANLKAQNRVDRERLLRGNWRVKEEAGMYFKSIWFNYSSMPPLSEFKKFVRAWDFAGTKKTDKNDPDATAGVLMGITHDGRVFVIDVIHEYLSPLEIDRALKATASKDKEKYGRVQIIIPQDPGQAGVYQKDHITKLLHGYDFDFVRPTTDKVVRCKPFSAQVEHGNVYLINGDWNDKYILELEGFPDADHDDMVDASSDSYNNLVAPPKNKTTFKEVLF